MARPLSTGSESISILDDHFASSPTTPPTTESSSFNKSQALGAAKAGFGALKAQSIFMQAGITKSNLDAAMSALRSQRAERAFRHQTNVRLLRRQAERAIAGKKEAFIKGGVKLEGSAIDVVNDTLMDLLRAEMNKQREQDFMNEQSLVEEANLRSRRENVDTVAMLNASASLLQGAL